MHISTEMKGWLAFTLIPIYILILSILILAEAVLKVTKNYYQITTAALQNAK